MSLRRMLNGPDQSPRSQLFIALSGVILGGLAALLGTVTHSGTIDGGTTGLIVALLTVLLGAAAFMLLAGVTGWASFGLGLLATLALSSMISDGDLIGALSPDMSHWWFYGSPVAILLGGVLAWLGYLMVGADKN